MLVPRYSYIALNQQHQKLTGVLSAESEANAREKLHAMAFSVVSLKEEAEIDYQKNAEEGVTTFAFFFRDSKGKESKGTIDAPNRKTAFRRLVAEYNFEILSLADATIPEEKRFEEGKNGLEELAEEVEEEFGVAFKKIGEKNEEQERKKSESFLERKKELVQSVEEIVKQAKDVLEKFRDEMTGDEVHSIKMRIDNLMRMRLSNNLKYIEDLSDELLTIVDETLRRHVGDDQTVQETAEEIADDIMDETMYQNAVKERGLIGNLKYSSNRLKRMIKGYRHQQQQKARRKKRLQGSTPEKQNPLLIKVRLAVRIATRSISQLIATALSKNSAVRRQHWETFRENFSLLSHLFQKSEEELSDIQAKTEGKSLSKKAEKTQTNTQFFFQKTLFHWIEELHLFFGWLLSFYVIYFYAGILIIVKGSEKNSFLSFLERSLTNAFPFLITGIFFLLFLGLTLCLRFARQQIWLTFFFMAGSAVLSALFVLNF